MYRKPTNNLSYIHDFSNHSLIVKQSVFQFMCLRAFRDCSPQYIDNEFITIATTGKKLCYTQCFLDRCASRAESRYYNNNINNNNMADCITLCLPYHKPFESVVQLLPKFNIRVVYKYENTIKILLIKNSPNNDRGCVYKISCKQCNRFYNGPHQHS